MKAVVYINPTNFVNVEVKEHPNYQDEIILGGERINLPQGLRDEIRIIMIFPGVRTRFKIRTKTDETIVGTLEKGQWMLMLNKD